MCFDNERQLADYCQRLFFYRRFPTKRNSKIKPRTLKSLPFHKLFENSYFLRIHAHYLLCKKIPKIGNTVSSRIHTFRDRFDNIIVYFLIKTTLILYFIADGRVVDGSLKMKGRELLVHRWILVRNRKNKCRSFFRRVEERVNILTSKISAGRNEWVKCKE